MTQRMPALHSSFCPAGILHASTLSLSLAMQNGGQETFTYRSQVARYALTDPPAGVDISKNSFNTTEIHCTEYYAGTTAGMLLPSPAVAQVFFLEE